MKQEQGKHDELSRLVVCAVIAAAAVYAVEALC